MFAEVKVGKRGGLFIITFTGEKRYVSGLNKGNPVVKMGRMKRVVNGGTGIMTSYVHYGKAKNDNPDGSTRFSWK